MTDATFARSCEGRSKWFLFRSPVGLVYNLELAANHKLLAHSLACSVESNFSEAKRRYL